MIVAAPVKLAVSNIAWGAAPLPDFLALLAGLGCAGVELAPSLLWPEPIDSSARERVALRGAAEAAGLEIVGFHALLFTRPELVLFGSEGSRRETVEYLKRLCELCGEVGGRVLVFGSAGSRARGGLGAEQALARAADAFRTVAGAAEEAGVRFLIEPLHPAETDFVTSTADGLRLVQLVDHPHFGLHLDAKAVLGEPGEPAAAVAAVGRLVEHVHASAPGLVPPESSGQDDAAFGAALRAAGYDGYVSLEMRRPDDPAAQIRRSVAYVRRCYLGA